MGKHVHRSVVSEGIELHHLGEALCLKGGGGLPVNTPIQRATCVENRPIMGEASVPSLAQTVEVVRSKKQISNASQGRHMIHMIYFRFEND